MTSLDTMNVRPLPRCLPRLSPLRGCLKSLVLVPLIVCIVCVGWRDPAAASTTNPSGPKIMLSDEDIARIRRIGERDPEMAKRLQALRDKSEEILNDDLLRHEFEVVYHGKPAVMLKVARKLEKRSTILGLAWRVWRDARYAERGRDELLAAATFRTWNPEHFLDTAEMSAAVAIGLDWLSDFLSDSDKRVLIDALIEKGIKPGLALYAAAEGEKGRGWVSPDPRRVHRMNATERADHGWPIETFNWNIVCNSGLTLAALAVRAHEPAIANELLRHSVASIRHGFDEFAPDGGFYEGLGYWSYATRYAAMFLDASEDVLGTDFGYSQSPGFSKTGDFGLHLTGPTGMGFNFGDSETDPNRVATGWLAKRFSQPIYAWFDSLSSPGSRLALDILWRGADPGVSPIAAAIPTARLFAGVDVATFRSAWQDDNAFFVALKAGRNAGHHTHLDLGTFVLDALGERWAIELGPDRYNLPGYFGNERWTYYRTKTAGQNTLVIDQQNQNLHAHAQISVFSHEADRSFAVADLGQAYGVEPSEVRRGIALIDAHQAMIQDEIGESLTGVVEWGMHTRAKAEPDPTDEALLRLRQNGKTLYMKIVEPKEARFKIRSAYQPPPQQPNEGVSKIVVALPASSRPTGRRIAVLFSAEAALPSREGAVVPLANW